MKRDRAREILSYGMEGAIEYAICGRRPMWVARSERPSRIGQLSEIGFAALHHTTSRPIRQHVRKSRARG